MRNGDVNEFVNHIYYGDELEFLYHGNHYFLQGLTENGIHKLYLDRWDPPTDDYVWIGTGTKDVYPVKAFLEAPLWDGKAFWAAEQEMEWIG